MIRILKNIIRNKYIVATIVFLAFMFFSDKNNIIEQYRLRKEYSKVKAEHDYYATQLAKARKDYNELFSSKKNLEKFAREKYLMKRDNEDVFVILDKQNGSGRGKQQESSNESDDD
ncbi:MAG: septum formation initiator family protein [Bacteroidia bacterium]